MRAPWLFVGEKRLTQCLHFEAAQGLSKILEGQTLSINVQHTSLTLSLAVKEQQVSLSHQPIEAPAAKVTGELKQLLKLLGHPKQRQGGILLEGDLGVLEGFSELMALASQDWEALLTPYLGDTLSYHLRQGLKKASHYSTTCLQSFKVDLKDYLQEEAKLLPTKKEVDHFMAHVDTLRLDTERLLARVDHLKNREPR